MYICNDIKKQTQKRTFPWTKIDQNNQKTYYFPNYFHLPRQVTDKPRLVLPPLASPLKGGLLLLREFDQRVGFIDRLNGCIRDDRSAFLIRHTYKEILTRRIFQIACGYEDANDCDLLRDDSILKLSAGKSPDSHPLSSQPTMSRLENRISIRGLYDMGVCFVEEFIASYGEEPGCIILDCDDSNFNAYGNQQGTLFNNYYDEYCYMPLFIVRGDGHFCSREFMDWATGKDYVEFVFGLAGNPVLNDRVRQWVDKATQAYGRNGEEVRFFRQLTYKAGSWGHPQRVIVKIEVNHHGANVRFIVTSFQHPNSRFIYESLYCGRGTMELYIKEMKCYLSSDRCSCNRFSANQFRLFLHAAAYVLLHGLKQEVFKGTCLYNVSILTLQQKILSGAVHVKQMKTKIKVEFSDKHPYRAELSLAFQRFSIWKGAA